MPPDPVTEPVELENLVADEPPKVAPPASTIKVDGTEYTVTPELQKSFQAQRIWIVECFG